MKQLNNFSGNKPWLAALAVAGVLAGGWWVYGANQDAQAGQMVQSEADERPLYYDLQPLVVNIASGAGRNRYLRIRPALEVRRSGHYDLLPEYEPLIRNTLLSLYSQTRPHELLEDQGFDHLRESSLATLQETLEEETGKRMLSGVLFTEYVIQ